jgi:hypothetical protein
MCENKTAADLIKDIVNQATKELLVDLVKKLGHEISDIIKSEIKEHKESSEKRKPGRPRKNKDDDKPKKPVGRPKKLDEDGNALSKSERKKLYNKQYVEKRAEKLKELKELKEQVKKQEE